MTRAVKCSLKFYSRRLKPGRWQGNKILGGEWEGSLCVVKHVLFLVPVANYPTLGVQHALEAGYIKTMLLTMTALFSFSKKNVKVA